MAKKTNEEELQGQEIIDQELYGDKVEKIGGRAIITVDGAIVSLVIPVTYDQVVNALVNEKYPQDKMQAIQNNYLDDPDNDGYKEEMKNMQDWRKTAKAAAHEILGI